MRGDYHRPPVAARLCRRCAGTADRCVALGLDPVRVRAIDVPDSRGIGVEAAAREARYHAIVDACSDASAVLLAHTKNDQAETVIIGLLRSAGLDAVCG